MYKVGVVADLHITEASTPVLELYRVFFFPLHFSGSLRAFVNKDSQMVYLWTGIRSPEKAQSLDRKRPR